MEAMTLMQILEVAAGGTAPAMVIVIWLLWKMDKRIQAVEINGQHQDKLLDEIKRKLDTVLTGVVFGAKDDST